MRAATSLTVVSGYRTKKIKLIADLRGQAQVPKNDTIDYQATVIKLKDDLLSAENEQLKTLESSVLGPIQVA